MAFVIDHDVGRLDVAVYNAFVVGEIDRIKEFCHQARRLTQRETLAGVECRLEFLAPDVLHDDIGDLAFLAEIVDLDDVGVVQARNGLRLPGKPHRILLRGGRVQFADQDGLDRDRAVQAGVEAFVDDTHGALAQDTLELVSAQRLERRRGHVRRWGPPGLARLVRPDRRVGERFGDLDTLFSRLLVPAQRGLVVTLHHGIACVVEIAETLLGRAMSGFPCGQEGSHCPLEVAIALGFQALLVALCSLGWGQCARRRPWSRLGTRLGRRRLLDRRRRRRRRNGLCRHLG